MSQADAFLPKQSDGIDAVAVLSVYVFLLFAIPSKLVFAPLGGAGTPAQIVCLACTGWYLWYRARLPTSAARRRPIQSVILIFAACIATSYVAAMIRPISDGEVNTADLGLLNVAGWVGIALVASEGIPSKERFLVFLRRISLFGGALATLGVVQFFTSRSFTDEISLPGLSVNSSFTGVGDRGSFTRPSGTAISPIEFGVVLAALLPIALVCAMVLADRSWLSRWFPVIAISVAIPLSISRSAIVGTIVCLVVILPTWSRVTRRIAYVTIVFLLATLFVFVPGFLGTLTGMFTGISSDSSAQSRTGSYAIAWEFIQRSPVVGRGFSTFLPSYWILDNQYIGLVIEMGILGLVAFVALLGTGIRQCVKAARTAETYATRQIGWALAASLTSLAVSTAFFDLLSFPMSAGVLFLLLGLSGALLRLWPQELPRAGSRRMHGGRDGHVGRQ